MSVHRAARLWHNRILRYHLVRGLALWLALEIVGIAVSRFSQMQMNSLLALAHREGVSVHIPAISVLMVDFSVAIMAALIYTRVALRRTEDRILLGNLGISGFQLLLMIAASGLLLAACTWGLR